jgi:hypothetical protein
MADDQQPPNAIRACGFCNAILALAASIGGRSLVSFGHLPCNEQLRAVSVEATEAEGEEIERE